MKTITKIFALSLVILGFSTVSFAQSSASASTSASLLTPISIVKDANMSFGTLATNATGGSVTLSTAGTLTPSSEGVVIMNSSTGTAAQFTVTGEANQSFYLTHPTTVTLSDGNSHTLVVNSIVNNIGALSGGKVSTTIGAGGTTIIKLGGTLVVPANAVKGDYSNASDLTVTVNYN